MTSRAGLAWLVITLLLAGCGSPQGKVLVTVVFENETRTQCIKTTASKNGGADINSNPAFLPRGGKDTLQIGLVETSELVGEVNVTIARFSTPDCAGTAFASETKATTLVHGGPVAKLEFRFVGMGGNDGGTDAGTGDGGLDAGCDVSNCGNTPGECETSTATGCAADGGCRFGFKPARTVCTTGVCNSAGTCIADVCSVLPDGMPCNDGLDCTPTSSCVGGVCRGTCGTIPQCNLPAMPLSCDPVTTMACALVPSNNFGSCTPTPGGQCLDGGCVPWLQFNPINFPVSGSLAVTPYPTAPWTLASTDGGWCDTVISTGPTPTVLQGDCGTPTLTSTVNDAGVLVLTNTGLDVGPNARLSFVGTRPVQLVVIGNATINGIVSVAPLIPGQDPAGTAPAACAAAVAGSASKQGGGGGGFGNVGGRGGESGGAGGGNTAMAIPLRGGCPGAAGFRATGSSPPGLGGGAIELIVADTLTMDGGVVTASGGGGAPGTADFEGGGGGGSGGTVIIEARIINLAGGAVTANGGGGGQGGKNGQTGLFGAQGPIDSATFPAVPTGTAGGPGGKGGDNQAPAGQNGTNGGGNEGGGGGGGAVGVIYVRGNPTCTRNGGVLSGATPLTFTCN